MAPLAERLRGARQMARHRRIKVTDIEARLGTRFTADTLDELRRRFPQYRFVWIVGADNLKQMARWNRWTRIFHTVPVAVFDRPTYAYQALASQAARRFGRHRLRLRQARQLAERPPPAWCFIMAARHNASATELRAHRAGPR